MWAAETIDVERSDAGITLVRFLHPDDDRGSAHQLSEVSDLFLALSAEPETRVIVLIGDGETFFRGPTLRAIQDIRASPERIVSAMATARRTLQHIVDCDKPVVAAVNGPAVGLGTTIALLSDIIVASDTALFRDPHVRIGVPAGDGGTLIWPLLLGLARAKRHLMLAEPLSAADAYALGVVSEVTPPAEVQARALDYADRLAGMAAFAVNTTKAALNQWLRLGVLASSDFANALQLAAQLQPEAGEIIAALADREPRDPEV